MNQGCLIPKPRRSQSRATPTSPPGAPGWQGGTHAGRRVPRDAWFRSRVTGCRSDGSGRRHGRRSHRRGAAARRQPAEGHRKKLNGHPALTCEAERLVEPLLVASQVLRRVHKHGYTEAREACHKSSEVRTFHRGHLPRGRVVMLGGAVAGSDPLSSTRRASSALSAAFWCSSASSIGRWQCLYLRPAAAGAVVVAANLGRPLEPHHHPLSPSGELWDQDAVSDG